ncbi:phage integrase [Burkholderia pseudomallei]|nr:phage integrase [Burkholderia pseudomallei]CAJ4234821.1 phage integrase [Burkholderia pseudomallei]CAK0569213.1 phage integrase [Burkholderia pseudomallei]
MSVQTNPQDYAEATALLDQPNDARLLPAGAERDSLIISMRKVDGVWRIVSRYGDDDWWPTGATTNTRESNVKLDFTQIPFPFREALKAMLYRYMRKGIAGGRRPSGVTLARAFREMKYFIQHIYGLKITTISGISTLVCTSYVEYLRTNGNRRNKKPLAKGTLYKRIRAVSDIYELSQYTDSPMPEHPWPDSSADHLSGYSKSRQNKDAAITPLIPNDVFVSLFQAAWRIVQDAPRLLDLRDEMQRLADEKRGLHPRYIGRLKTLALVDQGFDSYKHFKTKLVDIRTACYIVIASVSGCRNHELANLRTDSCYSSEDDDGEQYWWMRSESEKTFEGATEWMIPESAVTAIRVLERWAIPYQEMLCAEIEGYRAKDSGDVRIAQAEDHLDALVVGLDQKKGNLVRTLGVQALNNDLKDFAKACALEWDLASHQFRRKFANYAARSQFGDLRYLREHFKHWSMDMTLGYALNESQELALYLEIQDELDDLKNDVVVSWLDDSEPLAGGYGERLIDWRSRGENITLFKSHAAMVRSIAASTPIRSNGHAWCTAADNLCVGNDFDKTRCGNGCDSAVIGRMHASIYQGLYDHLKQLRMAPDIGPGGQERVSRDVSRCAAVLGKLGYKVEDQEPSHDTAA